jgi:hypothetical protein
MRRAVAVLSVALLASCTAPPPKSVAERTVDDPARGVRYVVPEDWNSYDGEVRSPKGSLLSLRVFDLVEADKTFVANLPDSLFPQLLGWSQWYYIVDGKPTRVETTVDGLPATELTYPVRVRPKDPPSRVTYWVVKRGTRLFVLRGAYPPQGLEHDEPLLRAMVAGWHFLDASPTDAAVPAPAGAP